MVQKPTSRRSKPTRQPVTIDLEATELKDETVKRAPPREAEPVAFGRGPAPDAETVVEEIEETTAPGTEEAAGMDEAARDAVEGGERPAEQEAQPERAEPEPAQRGPVPRTGRNLHAIGGGIIGGLVALLVAGGLQWVGLVPSLRETPSVDLGPLQSQVDGLSAKLATLENATPSVAADLTAEIDAVRAVADANSQAVATLEQKLATLAESGDAGDGAGVEALSSRVGSVETQLSDLARKLATLETSASDPAALDALRAGFETAAQSVESLKSDVSALGERLSAAEKEIDSGAGNRVAVALAASALKSAADRGSAFMSELEAYAAINPDKTGVGALQDYAASGVPTLAQLTERYPSVANAIVAAANGAGPDAGIGEKLIASARSLVQVRPVGEVEGDEPGAIAARMEIALAAGDFDSMIAEWEKLPEASRQASVGFMDDVKARRELDTLISNILTGAMRAGAPQANR
ncbi:MAG: mitofilin family membrane protein [Oricola sp.]